MFGYEALTINVKFITGELKAKEEIKFNVSTINTTNKIKLSKTSTDDHLARFARI